MQLERDIAQIEIKHRQRYSIDRDIAQIEIQHRYRYRDRERDIQIERVQHTQRDIVQIESEIVKIEGDVVQIESDIVWIERDVDSKRYSTERERDKQMERGQHTQRDIAQIERDITYRLLERERLKGLKRSRRV